MIRGISAVDLFCGAGGLSHGFVREGIRVNVGLDLDPDCKYPFEKNNGGTAWIACLAKLSHQGGWL